MNKKRKYVSFLYIPTNDLVLHVEGVGFFISYNHASEYCGKYRLTNKKIVTEFEVTDNDMIIDCFFNKQSFFKKIYNNIRQDLHYDFTIDEFEVIECDN